MRVDDSPAPAHLDDALELAEILHPTWPEHREINRREAAFLNDGEEDAEGEDQPSHDAEAPSEDQPSAEEEAFTDAYDPVAVPDEVRPTYEAAYKRLQSDYTKKRMTDGEAVREAQQANLIVEGLQDPQRAPAILQALGVQIGEEEEVEEFDDFADPNERIDSLERQLAERDQLSESQARVQAENAFVTEQVEKLEGDLGFEFSDEELGLLYMYADEYRDDKGNPDVSAAHKVLDAIASTAAQRVLRPRRGAPRGMGRGSAAERKVDLSNPEKRLEAMTAAAAAAKASSE